MELQVTTALLAIIVSIVFLAIYYYKNRCRNSNKEWREKYFQNFDFKYQSKEIDVT